MVLHLSNQNTQFKPIQAMTTAIQQNTYNVIYSNGKPSKIYITASNIKEASKKAKAMQKEIGSAYYKVVRCYNGGVRG